MHQSTEFNKFEWNELTDANAMCVYVNCDLVNQNAIPRKNWTNIKIEMCAQRSKTTRCLMNWKYTLSEGNKKKFNNNE